MKFPIVAILVKTQILIPYFPFLRNIQLKRLVEAGSFQGRIKYLWIGVKEQRGHGGGGEGGMRQKGVKLGQEYQGIEQQAR